MNLSKIPNLKKLSTRIPATHKSEPVMTERLRQQCFERDDHECVECHSDYKIVCDHIIRLVDGGTNEMKNLQTLCENCHKEKTSKEARRC
jgi:5-methylcytosine-specific restriction endonuclease McrA